MDTRARALIETLQLQPHPEGGYYGEIYRSAARVSPDDGRPMRAAVTTIYFLLTDDQYSCWHRVRSDELWHFYEGAPLDLFLGSPAFDRVEHLMLGSLAVARQPVQIAPAGWWQAARTSGAYSLVGCTVAPGFEFADFVCLRDDPDGERALGMIAQEFRALA